MSAKVFLKNYIDSLNKIYDVTLIANFKENTLLREFFNEIRTIDIPIDRKISLANDIKSLLALIHIIRKENFFSVHPITPKAGLLSMISAFIAGIPNRFHTFTGQVWVTKSGIYRSILKYLDKITFKTSTAVLVDSPSQRDFLIKEGIISETKSSVLGNGSISGIDTSRFKPSKISRSSVRATHGLDKDSFIFLFLGRINKEKGIAELVRAFLRSGCISHGGILMLIGPEEDDVLSQVTNELIKINSAFVRVGFTDQPEHYMAAADVFCLPSHREGFGLVIIEAAACGVPAIASNIYGISDAIENDVTGILHPAHDESSIADAMIELMKNPKRLLDLSQKGRERATRLFSNSILKKQMMLFYKDQFNKTTQNKINN